MLPDLTAHLPRLKMRRVQPRKPRPLAHGCRSRGGIRAWAGLLPVLPQPPLSTRRTPGCARLGLPFSHTQDSKARNSSHWASNRLWATGTPSAFQQLPEGQWPAALESSSLHVPPSFFLYKLSTCHPAVCFSLLRFSSNYVDFLHPTPSWKLIRLNIFIYYHFAQLLPAFPITLPASL